MAEDPSKKLSIFSRKEKKMWNPIHSHSRMFPPTMDVRDGAREKKIRELKRLENGSD